MTDFQDSLLAMLKRHEGLSLILYEDSVGIPTFGYGHNAREPISLEAATQILSDDIGLAYQDLDRNKPFWRTLPHDVKLVVVNMCFNLGWPRYARFVKFWAAVEAHQFRQASIEMRESLWCTQVKSRAEELIQLMASAHKVTDI